MEIDESIKNRIKEVCEECKKNTNVPVCLMLHNGVIKSNFTPFVEITYLKDFEYFFVDYKIIDNDITTLSFLGVVAKTEDDIIKYCNKYKNVTFKVENL